jgi:ABC-type transport system substrate-binding protein
MKRRLFPLLAATSAVLAVVLVVAQPARSSRRPKSGGVLRVEMAAVVNSMDPAAPAANPVEAAAKREIDGLLYERRNPDGTFAGAAGSGAFRLAEWEPGKHASLAANPDFAGGRSFLDSIEIQMGRSDRDRLLDLELGKADFATLPPGEVRQARDRGIRVSVSEPDELLALVLLAGRPATADARVGEALSRSIDRAAIVNFILQKEGEPAGGLLPGWSSGTAFLFSTAVDVSAARALWGQIASSPKIALGYDAGDPLEQAVAERIVVNAREASITLRIQAVAGPAAAAANVDARLVRMRMNSPHPSEALANLQVAFAPLAGWDAKSLSPEGARPGTPGATTPEQIYERERSIVNGYRIVPLVWLPQVYGLSSRVRDWSAPAAGDPWPLADVWLGDAP